MISPKRLIEKAMRRGVFSFVAEKGHFVVYSAERKRFMLPLAYLKSDMFRELLKMSEDEFGLGGDGPIVLPCDAGFLECALTILQGSKDVERELFGSLLIRHCWASDLLV